MACAREQYLEEDPRTNRIDDSLQLFTAICSNKLLGNAALVLMLNKVRLLSAFVSHFTTDGRAGGQTDLLRQKLEAGIKVRK